MHIIENYVFHPELIIFLRLKHKVDMYVRFVNIVAVALLAKTSNMFSLYSALETFRLFLLQYSIWHILQKQSYPMNLPRLGIAIIINNLSSSMPGSEVDVDALNKTLQTIGFEVQVFRDRDQEVSLTDISISQSMQFTWWNHPALRIGLVHQRDCD